MPFDHVANTLIWRGGHETLQIEPWGADSLRVRATHAGMVCELPGALLAPAQVEAQIVIGPEPELKPLCDLRVVHKSMALLFVR